MSTIQLTNNTTLDVTVSPVDGNATLNRYLKHPLSFVTPAGLQGIAGISVGDLETNGFPFTASPTGGGKFAFEGTSLGVSLGATATVDLLKHDKAEDFLKSAGLAKDAAGAGLVAFGIKGTLSAGPTAKVDDFCFGVTDGATVSLTSYSKAESADTFVDAVKRAIGALTFPHDLADLKTLQAGAICQMEASSCLKFTASVTYNILNNPLATETISQLPAITVNAKAAATLEAAATHTAAHTVTIARLPDHRLHLSVNLKNTDDFETSLTAAAVLTAGVEGADALTLLLGKISPGSQAEVEKLKADLPPGQAEKLTADIKTAIDAALCSSLQMSLKTALDETQCKNPVFLYEIDLDGLDESSTAALGHALAGDFSMLTKPNAALAGIRQLDSALTVTSTVKHCLTVHLLGIFNYGSMNTFIEKSSVEFTQNKQEIVLSDQQIDVVNNNLDSQKLREIVVKATTLTLPAAANTPAATSSLNMVFFDREGSTSFSRMRQFANVLRVTGSASSDQATTLMDENLGNYGPSSLYLSLSLRAAQCRQLFVDSQEKARDWTWYLDHACDAQRTILHGDPEDADRLKLFTLGREFWEEWNREGSPDNIRRSLGNQGIRKEALVDVVTVLWWATSMGAYAQAVAGNQALEGTGKELVKDSNRGFNEPWLILATWNMLENPALESLFTCSPPPRAIGA